jgi:hypothetical protein
MVGDRRMFGIECRKDLRLSSPSQAPALSFKRIGISGSLGDFVEGEVFLLSRDRTCLSPYAIRLRTQGQRDAELPPQFKGTLCGNQDNPILPIV